MTANMNLTTGDYVNLTLQRQSSAVKSQRQKTTMFGHFTSTPNGLMLSYNYTEDT